MKFVLAGGSGFLGRSLTTALIAAGQDVVVLTRRPPLAQLRQGGPRFIEWDPDGEAGPWASEIDGAQGVVNLTGAGIADRRWTADRKDELRSSRVLSTRSLVSAVRAASRPPAVFLQGSAVGFYGADGADRELDESFPPGDDFLGQLCVAWEAEAHPAEALGCRVVILRSGVVLGRGGGLVKRLRLPFRLFAGGPISTGRQYISWVHCDDWLKLVQWALATPTLSGPINATAPTPVTNAELSQSLARALHRPSWLRVPALALKAIYGEMADSVLIGGQRVVPRRALALGFTFAYPRIDAAMDAAV
jgi:uncharacterized protein (TIGR01777 family)